jgi:outer membrane biosynthesis protein TonB
MEVETLEAVTAQDLEGLLAQAREKLEGLVRELRALDAQLDSLAIERKQHRLLHDACGALEELRQTGGASLFWGEGAAASDEHIRRVRNLVDVFQKRVSEIEDSRRALLEEITQHEEHTYLLEDDVFEALDEEEQRKNEWLVEREIDGIRAGEAAKPWTQAAEDDRRFRKSVAAALVLSLLFALIVPLIDLPLSELQEAVEVPERVVTMMMEEHPLPPPPVEIKPKPQERVAEQKPIEKPVPQKSAKPEEQKPEPTEVPGPEQGILAFREKLAALKEAPILARLGSQAHINNSNQMSRPERSMLTTNAPGSSGGIKLAALSRDFGPNGGGERGAIRGAALTRASSNISTIGPADHPSSSGPGLARTDEEIQIVFDRYKSSLYRLYNRELRKDPTLQGKMILRLTIQPDGSVSFCELSSTDMNAPELVAQIVQRVGTFDFGAKDVPAITIVYPIDFLPAA